MRFIRGEIQLAEAGEDGGGRGLGVGGRRRAGTHETSKGLHWGGGRMDKAEDVDEVGGG